MSVMFTASSGRLLHTLKPFALKEFMASIPDDAEIEIQVQHDGNQQDPAIEAYTFNARWSAEAPAKTADASLLGHPHKPGYRSADPAPSAGPTVRSIRTGSTPR